MWPFDRYPVLRQVIVNTKTDKAFKGVLWARRGPYLVLRSVALLKGRGETLAMDGELVVHQQNVDFMQVVG